jgi:hypothetical protein
MVSKFEKTREIEVQGKSRWAHLLQLNKYGAWSIELFPTRDSLEIIRELQADGLKNVLKKDPEDGWYIAFRREPTKKIRGAIVNFPAPMVMDAEGKKFTGEVGNGSDVTITLEVYTHGTPSGGTAVAARLKAVRIDNLVPFERKKDYTDEQKPTVERLISAPPQQEEYWQ